MDIAYLNFLLASKKTVNEPCPYWLQQLFNNFGYTIPSAARLESVIKAKAIESAVKANLNADILPCLIIQTQYVDTIVEEITEQKLYVLALAISRSHEYEFIDFTLLSDDHTLNVKFHNYCDQVVQKTYDKYNVKILSTITNFKADIETVSNFRNSLSKYNYTRSKNFMLLVSELSVEEYDGRNCNRRNSELLLSHDEKIKSFSQKLLDAKTSMGDAVQYLFTCLKDKTFDFHPDADNLILKYLTPFRLGCNMFDHR